ncbi:MAG TPA: methyltransferase domain-containing protein [Verrucomicrobiae bacterium]|nr:methyltransferase domain-containing protein [Verrucomicrobiae bacterium]
MNTDQAYQKEIVSYYNATQFDYRAVWELDKTLAIHYGYWDEEVTNFADSLIRFNEILAQKLRLDAADSVLDAGCGVGGSSIFMAKEYGCSATGISISEQQVADAKANAEKAGLSGKTTFIQGDYLNTPFPAESFTAAFGLESVCYAEDKTAFCKEMYRVLKKGGRVTIADGYQTETPRGAAGTKMMRKWLDGWKVKDLETPSGIKRALKDAGFKNIQYENVTPQVWRSAVRLYRFSFPAFLVTGIGQLIRLRSGIQTGNVVAAHYQYRAMKKGLWEYGIVTAEK